VEAEFLCGDKKNSFVCGSKNRFFCGQKNRVFVLATREVSCGSQNRVFVWKATGEFLCVGKKKQNFCVETKTRFV
jgi:hypothetical protein